MASKLRSVRVDDERWARWQAAADEAQTAVSDFIRDAVDRAIEAGLVPPPPALRNRGGRAASAAEPRSLGARDVTPDFKVPRKK